MFSLGDNNCWVKQNPVIGWLGLISYIQPHFSNLVCDRYLWCVMTKIWTQWIKSADIFWKQLLTDASDRVPFLSSLHSSRNNHSSFFLSYSSFRYLRLLRLRLGDPWRTCTTPLHAAAFRSQTNWMRARDWLGGPDDDDALDRATRGCFR